MNKTECLKKAKLFLKMTECDVALIKILRISKIILTAALFLNSAGFAAMILCGMKKIKS